MKYHIVTPTKRFRCICFLNRGSCAGVPDSSKVLLWHSCIRSRKTGFPFSGRVLVAAACTLQCTCALTSAGGDSGSGGLMIRAWKEHLNPLWKMWDNVTKANLSQCGTTLSQCVTNKAKGKTDKKSQ
eukprot:2909697-Amphidinium_carterae.1